MNISGDPPSYEEFDLTCTSLDKIKIKESTNKDNCYVWDVNSTNNIIYNRFVLSKNTLNKTICEITFYQSSNSKKYIPRLIFKKLLLDGVEKGASNPEKIIISFSKSDDAEVFWKLISFFQSYKDLVDTGNFNQLYKVVENNNIILKFKNNDEKEKIEILKKLINVTDFSTSDIMALTYEERKKNLKAFYYLLKNISLEDGDDSHTKYRGKYDVNPGEECIWHHFLKKHDWILGLNADIRFIIEFLDEQQVGTTNSKGQDSPQVDLLGINDFTVLVELKHSNTLIFKKTKAKGRALTWDLTTDFIEGISQCLAQKFESEKAFDQKVIINNEGNELNKSQVRSVDPKSILLIGNKRNEFPIDKFNHINIIKNDTLERFRRNNRNIDVLTYDELFERAYHIVYSKKLDRDWYEQDESEIFN